MIHLMQKLDAMTPWHSLRTYDTVEQAKCAAYTFAQQRQPGEQYPKYEVNGMTY